MVEQSEKVEPFASGHGLARAAAFLLALFAFISVPLVGVSLSNMRAMQVLQSISAPVEAIAPGEAAREAIWILSRGLRVVASLGERIMRPATIIGVVAGIVSLFWIYRVHANLSALGARNLKNTSFWAVGWWLIPFAHLVFPYRIMREIWHRSDPGDGELATLQLASPGALLGWWWALMVSALLLEFYYPFWAQMTGGTVFGVTSAIDDKYFYAEATSAALNIAAAILGILVVLSIDRMQSVKHQRMAATAAAGGET